MSLFYRRRMLLQKKALPKTLGKTTIYNDGTFIINEYAEDRAANIALHGIVRAEYDSLDASHPYVYSFPAYRPWNSYANFITSVKFGSPVQPTSTAQWFANFQNMTSFDATNLDMSNVTNASAMFNYCTKIKTLDVSSFNTSNITDMGQMFNACQALTVLDVTNFDTSKVTNMANFASSSFALIEVDLSSFNTPLVNHMGSMFNDSNKLQTIYASNSFVTAQVTNSINMFRNCHNIVGGAGTTFNSSYVDKNRAKIDGGTSNPGYFVDKTALTHRTTLFADGTLIINEPVGDRAANIATHGAVSNEYRPLDSAYKYLFNQAVNRPWVGQVDLIRSVKFGAPIQPTNMAYWFTDCTNLSSLDSTNLDTSNVTTMINLFSGCGFTSLDLSSWNLSNVTTMESMFNQCQSLQTVSIGTSVDNYNTSVNTNNLFAGANSISGITLNGTNILRLTNSAAISNVPATCQIKVPTALVSDYQAATNWSSRAAYISAI